MPTLWGNIIYIDSADPAQLVVSCYNDTARADPYALHSRFSLVEWQKLGHNVGDAVQKTPSTAELVAMAREVLMML